MGNRRIRGDDIRVSEKYAESDDSEDFQEDSEDSEDSEDCQEQEYRCSTGNMKRKARGRVGPGDEKFGELVLPKIGLVVLNEFRGELPPQRDVQEREGSVPSSVHLTLSDSEVTHVCNQFLTWHFWNQGERELMSLLTTNLARFPGYITASDQCIAPLRKEGWTPEKDGPRIPEDSQLVYDWDFEHHMTYMVTINLFEDATRQKLKQSEFEWILAEPQGVCPYLTFHITTSGTHTELQKVSAASVLWLNQRRKLKEMLRTPDMSELRHYSVVIHRQTFYLYETKCEGNGYLMRGLCTSTFFNREGVDFFVKWNNYIHQWALETDAVSFRRDVELFLST